MIIKTFSYFKVAIVIDLETLLYQSCQLLFFKSSGIVPCPSSLGVNTFKSFEFKKSANFSISFGAAENPWIAIMQVFEFEASKYLGIPTFLGFIFGLF